MSSENLLEKIKIAEEWLEKNTTPEDWAKEIVRPIAQKGIERYRELLLAYSKEYTDDREPKQGRLF